MNETKFVNIIKKQAQLLNALLEFYDSAEAEIFTAHQETNEATERNRELKQEIARLEEQTTPQLF